MHSVSDTHTYTLQFSGALDEDFLAAFCPAGATLTTDGEISTLAHLQTDQCGLLGLLRLLHDRGCAILSLATT